MAKSTSQFICSACGSVHPKWSGKCDDCGQWNTISEQVMEVTPKGLSGGAKGRKIDFVPLDAESQGAPRQATGIGELDRVLGGGLVAGSAILIGGDPGIGKSTLLLQAVVSLAGLGLNCTYISGEESVAQVSLRARRLGLHSKNILMASATSVRDILASIDKDSPQILIIDSIQTMYIDNIEAAPGTVSQVRAASHELIKLAKKHGTTLFLVGHVTKMGR
jgi:DNA repair protein RadA/Sms